MTDASAPQSQRSLSLDRIAALPSRVLLSAAAVVFLALTVPAALGDSDTADENMHLWAAFRHATEDDFTVSTWHPPVAKMLQAVPMLLLGARAPEDLSRYAQIPPWSQGYAFLYRAGNSPAAVLQGPRLIGLIWGIAVLVLSYFLSRDLFGRTGALITLVLATACPTLLAHAHLATTDAAATALLLLTVLVFRNFVRNPGAIQSIVFGIVLGLALCTKYNLLFLVPMFMVLYAVALFLRKRPETPDPPTPEAASPRGLRAWSTTASWILLIGVTSYAVIWALYGFRYAPAADPALTLTWSFDLSGTSGGLIRFAKDHQLLPEAYLHGVATLRQFMASGHPSFALGMYSQYGWAWYFPLSFLVKTPVPTLLLYGWGIWSTARSLKAQAPLDKLCILLPLGIYWFLAINSTLMGGVRYLLPVFPLSAILAGAVGTWAIGPRRQGAIATLLAVTLVGVVSSTPYYIAYFNLPSTLVYERHQMLVDANLDWGQDLGRLKAYMDRNGIASVKLGYFGNASPRALGLQHERLPGFNLYSRYEPEWKIASDPAPGDWVAVSTTNLSGVLLPDKRYYLDRVGHLEPVARIGHSIHLYRIPPAPQRP